MTEFERRAFHQELEVTIARRRTELQHKVLWLCFRLAVVLVIACALIAKMTK